MRLRYSAVGIAVFVLGGLVPPALAQPATRPEPKLIAMPGSGFPDRSYVLRIPPRAGVQKPLVTENGGPVVGLAVSAGGGRASGTYVVSYRSVLPPRVEAVVRVTIPGLPAATATYTTPALGFTASGDGERRWIDSQYLTIVAVAALLALLGLDLFSRLRHRY